MNCTIRQSMYGHGLLKARSNAKNICKKQCGVYIIIGDMAFDTDGGSAYRLAKYLCINGYYPLTLPASYAKSNRIEKDGIPIITVGGSRANEFTKHIHTLIINKGGKLPFGPDLPGCRSKHKMTRASFVSQCTVIYCDTTLGFPVIFLFGDHPIDTSNAVDIFIGVKQVQISASQAPYIQPGCVPAKILKTCNQEICKPVLYCSDDINKSC